MTKGDQGGRRLGGRLEEGTTWPNISRAVARLILGTAHILNLIGTRRRDVGEGVRIIVRKRTPR